MVHFHSLNEPWDTALQLVRGKRPNIDTKKLLLSFLLAIWSLKFPQRLSIIDILTKTCTLGAYSLISKKFWRLAYRPAVIQPSQPSTGSSRVGVKFHKKFKYDPQTSTTRLGAAGLAASHASRLQNLQGGG